MVEISEYMIRANPWWKTHFEFILDFKYREILSKIEKYLPLKQIIALVGLRRVGKTMIMKKIIQNEISRGFSHRHILYFSFDEFQNEELETILAQFEELTDIEYQSERILLVLDEIQKMRNWQNQIKTYYDLYPNIKIILSGSESLFIQKSSKETLAGRIFLFRIDTLTFREFIKFKGKNFDDFSPISLYQHELKGLWNEFIRSQGFPELVGIHDQEIIKKYLEESLLEKILFKEIPYSYNIRDISLLETLLKLIYQNPGQIIQPAKIAVDLGKTRQTISQYLTYLENSFLIKKLYNFSRDLRKVERKLKRYYPSIVSVDLVFKNDVLSKSKIFEWAVIKLLGVDFFWRNSQQNEVDAILVGDNKELYPIEVKFGKIQTKGLMKFMKQFKIDQGYIISWKEDKIIKIPQTQADNNHNKSYNRKQSKHSKQSKQSKQSKGSKESKEVKEKSIVVIPVIKYFLSADKEKILKEIKE